MTNITLYHREAELLRLNSGEEGCGCADCQEYYKTLDLSVYGPRVKLYNGMVFIFDGASLKNHPRQLSPALHDTTQGGQDGGKNTKQVNSHVAGEKDTTTTRGEALRLKSDSFGGRVNSKSPAKRGRPRLVGLPVSLSTARRRQNISKGQKERLM
jgi:hypothetical protein